ncbi:MAG: hypothetical protein IJW55_08505 [Clostridia bacterium]|nr:hypothetical protein [Clostridia bacterium]
MRRNKWIRLVACGFLALLMIVSCVACKNDRDKTPADTQPSGVETGDTDIYAALPKVDFGGRDVIVGCPWDNGWRHEDYTGNVLDDAEFERNVAFEETYNCEIIAFKDSNLATIVQNTHLAGNSDFDLLEPHPTVGINGLITTGALADLYQLSTITLSSPWYNQSQIVNYTVKNKLFLCVPDATIGGQGFYGLAYNRDLYNQYNLDIDLEKSVRERKWTAELLSTILVDTASENDGGTAGYGLILNEGASNRWLYALGTSILKKDSEGNFTLAMTQSALVKACEMYCKVLYSGNYLLTDEVDNAGFPTSELYLTFKSGNSLFMTWDFGALYTPLRDLEFEKGYLPLPMADELQKDYSVICAAGFYAIPVNCKSLEESAILMEYAAIHGYNTLKPAFFETIINGRLSEYPQDAEMLELMHACKTYDLGFTLDSGNVVYYMLRDTIMPTKTAAGSAVWFRTNQNQLNDIVTRANAMANIE